MKLSHLAMLRVFCHVSLRNLTHTASICLTLGHNLNYTATVLICVLVNF